MNNKHLMGEEEIEALRALIESGDIYRYQGGESECEKFEEEFCSLFGFEKSILVTSGTNAIVAALLSLEIGPGDEVIIPSYTYIATASAIISVGAIPVVVNIQRDLTISVKEINSSITEKTKAIIPVHMDGLQCDIEKIVELAKKNNLFVIEDVAQAMGGKFKDKYLGTFGDIGCYSLNIDKILSCGEGGIVSTTRPDLIEKLLCISDHGYSFNPLHKDHFKTILPFLGLSMRMSDFSGALMRVQLKKLKMIQNLYRIRKEIFVREFEKNNSSFNLTIARDESGDCCTSVHVDCVSPDKAMELSKKLLRSEIYAGPVALRNAHCVWKWGDMLGDRSSLDPRLNPYQQVQKKYLYNKYLYLDSIDCLMSTVRIEIDINKSEEATLKEAQILSSSCNE